MGYGLFEEVYSLHKKKWMDDETWQQWSAFLELMTNQPMFRRIHRAHAGHTIKSSRTTSRSRKTAEVDVLT